MTLLNNFRAGRRSTLKRELRRRLPAGAPESRLQPIFLKELYGRRCYDATQTLHLPVLRRRAHLSSRHRARPLHARATINSLAHMISQSTSKTGTAIEVPKERAPANCSKTHHFEPKPEVLSLPVVKTHRCRRQVQRIAVRLASQPPRRDSNPAVHIRSARKSLIVSPEIKTHNA